MNKEDICLTELANLSQKMATQLSKPNRISSRQLNSTETDTKTSNIKNHI